MKKNTKNGRLIWSVIALVGMVSVLVFSPTVLRSKAFASESPAGIERVELKIDGMTCRKCVKPMQKALLALPGVTAADVSYSDANAKVQVKKGKVSNEQLVQTIEEKSNFFYTYKAKVISRK